MGKSSFIAVCGAPNAGKSTLINLLVGEKVTIVSPRPQTTRVTIRGIAIYDDTQLVFIDTPGIFDPKSKRQGAMVKSAWSGVDEAEQILFLVDAKKGLDEKARRIIDGLKRQGKKAICAINKVDLIEKGKLLPITLEIDASGAFSEIFMISAKKGDAVEGLKDHLLENASERDWPYPEDQVSDANERFAAAEITREKIFYLLQKELPYGVDVETEKFDESKKDELTIHQLILTGRENHKKIIIGKKAEMVKKIGMDARKEMEELFGCKVNLFLHVKYSKEIESGLE